MYLKQIIMAIGGLGFGIIVSGGVFTVLVAVGLVSRFAGKTHTGKYILLYESCICAGTISGCIFSVFNKSFHIGDYIIKHEVIDLNLWSNISNVLLSVFGIFAGIFIGCLAVAIAEMLHAFPIFSRRMGFRHGVGFALLSIAIGKLVGSLIYFSQHLFRYGG